MTDKEMKKIKASLPEWDKQSDDDKKLDQELSCREMINSILIYGYLDNDLDEIYANTYLRNYKKDISEERIKELIKEQQADLKKSKINNDVYTDGEGVSYNSVTWYDENEDIKEEGLFGKSNTDIGSVNKALISSNAEKLQQLQPKMEDSNDNVVLEPMSAKLYKKILGIKDLYEEDLDNEDGDVFAGTEDSYANERLSDNIGDLFYDNDFKMYVAEHYDTTTMQLLEKAYSEVMSELYEMIVNGDISSLKPGKKLKESVSGRYQVWQKYFEDGLSPKAEYVMSFDNYEKASKFAEGLNEDPDCDAWVVDTELNESKESNLDNQYYINRLNELQNQYKSGYGKEDEDIKQEVIRLLDEIPNGFEAYRVSKETNSGWTAYGSYHDEYTVLVPFRKNNDTWTYRFREGKDSKDAAISVLGNSGDFMTKEEAEAKKKEQEKDDKSYHRDIVNVGTDKWGNPIGKSTNRIDYPNRKEESKELRKYNSRLYGIYDTEREEYIKTGTLEEMKAEVENEKEDIEEKPEEQQEDKKDININITVKNEDKKVKTEAQVKVMDGYNNIVMRMSNKNIPAKSKEVIQINGIKDYPKYSTEEINKFLDDEFNAKKDSLDDIKMLYNDLGRYKNKIDKTILQKFDDYLNEYWSIYYNKQLNEFGEKLRNSDTGVELEDIIRNVCESILLKKYKNIDKFRTMDIKTLQDSAYKVWLSLLNTQTMSNDVVPLPVFSIMDTLTDKYYTENGNKFVTNDELFANNRVAQLNDSEVQNNGRYKVIKENKEVKTEIIVENNDTKSGEFILYIKPEELVDVNIDSMLFDSNTTIATLTQGIYCVILVVNGEVKIYNNENGDVYRYVQDFPEDFIEAIKNGDMYSSEKYYVDMNNWFEYYITENDEEVTYDVAEIEGLLNKSTPEENELVLKDIMLNWLEEYKSEIGVNNDTIITEALYSDGYNDDLPQEYPEEIRNKYYEYVGSLDLVDEEPTDFRTWVSEEYPDIYNTYEWKSIVRETANTDFLGGHPIDPDDFEEVIKDILSSSDVALDENLIDEAFRYYYDCYNENMSEEESY